MKLLFVSCISVTLEIDNNEAYYAPNFFDVYLNEEVVKSHIKNNVFSLYDLEPDTEYEVRVNNDVIKFKTKPVSEIIEINDINNKGKIDVTNDIQKYLDIAKDNALVVLPSGEYLFTSLFIKSNTTFYVKKGATLSALTIERKFQEIDGEETVNGKLIERGTWEGSPSRMKLSLINFVDVTNSCLIGEGNIDAHADKSTWWIDFRKKEYARPHIIFLNQSNNITIQGINLFNSPQWTVHPYFCSDLNFLDMSITNPKISPNTDGINPQCSKNVNIIGVHFSVGDDCVAIKSGKMYIGSTFKTPSEFITIRNCLMEHGHGAVVLGSEMSGGIKNLDVERCIFSHTDRGLRIKTRRGRGSTAVIDGVTFKNIIMDNVLTPLVINMFYFCDPDGKTEYVYSKDKLPVDDRTPYLGKFIFSNIKAINCEYSAGYFYGLPEQFIGEIDILDSLFEFKSDAGKGTPAMMSFAEECSKKGFVFNNVKKVVIKNVTMLGQEGPVYNVNNVEGIEYE